MKREIKFRAWHLDDGMLYFDFDSFQKDYHDQYGNIMQFTGLTDKNGKEIYEGDILKCVDEFNENEKVIEVVFKNGGYCIEWDGMFYDGSDITLISWANETGIEFEIIGNIYENPELLKQNNND